MKIQMCERCGRIRYCCDSGECEEWRDNIEKIGWLDTEPAICERCQKLPDDKEESVIETI